MSSMARTVVASSFAMNSSAGAGTSEELNTSILGCAANLRSRLCARGAVGMKLEVDVTLFGIDRAKRLYADLG